MTDKTEKRWKAVATYRSDAGPIDIEWDIEELEELQDLVERGPDWNCLVDIRITLNRRYHGMTVEQSAEWLKAN